MTSKKDSDSEYDGSTYTPEPKIEGVLQSFNYSFLPTQEQSTRQIHFIPPYIDPSKSKDLKTSDLSDSSDDIFTLSNPIEIHPKDLNPQLNKISLSSDLLSLSSSSPFHKRNIISRRLYNRALKNISLNSSDSSLSSSLRKTSELDSPVLRHLPQPKLTRTLKRQTSIKPSISVQLTSSLSEINDTIIDKDDDIITDDLDYYVYNKKVGNLYNCIQNAIKNKKLSIKKPEYKMALNDCNLDHLNNIQKYYFDAYHNKVYKEFYICEKIVHYKENSKIKDYKFIFVSLKNCITTNNHDEFVSLIYLQNDDLHNIKCANNIGNYGCYSIIDILPYSFNKIIKQIKEKDSEYDVRDSTEYDNLLSIIIDIYNLLFNTDIKYDDLSISQKTQLWTICSDTSLKNINELVKQIPDNTHISELSEDLQDNIFNEYLKILKPLCEIINPDLPDLSVLLVRLKQYIFHIVDTSYYTETKYCIKICDKIEHDNKYITEIGIIHNLKECNLQKYETETIKYSSVDFSFTLIYNILKYIEYDQPIYINDASKYMFNKYSMYTCIPLIIQGRNTLYTKYGYKNDYSDYYGLKSLLNVIIYYIISVKTIVLYLNNLEEYADFVDNVDESYYINKRKIFDLIDKNENYALLYDMMYDIEKLIDKNFEEYVENKYDSINHPNYFDEISETYIEDDYKLTKIYTLISELYLNYYEYLQKIYKDEYILNDIFEMSCSTLKLNYNLYVILNKYYDETIQNKYLLDPNNLLSTPKIKINDDIICINYNILDKVCNHIIIKFIRTIISSQIANNILEFDKYKNGEFIIE